MHAKATAVAPAAAHTIRPQATPSRPSHADGRSRGPRRDRTNSPLCHQIEPRGWTMLPSNSFARHRVLCHAPAKPGLRRDQNDRNIGGHGLSGSRVATFSGKGVQPIDRARIANQAPDDHPLAGKVLCGVQCCNLSFNKTDAISTMLRLP